MSNLINPLLVDGYIDEQHTQSVQGCYTGSDYWEAECQADKALEAERIMRARRAALKQELEQREADMRAAVQRGHNRKAAYLQERITEIRNILGQ